MMCALPPAVVLLDLNAMTNTAAPAATFKAQPFSDPAGHRLSEQLLHRRVATRILTLQISIGRIFRILRPILAISAACDLGDVLDETFDI